jgi:hypothetical protein
MFGISELTLRLPSLLGGALYFLMAYRLSLYIVGEGWLLLLSVAVLSLHPLLLDFLSAARGYGMAAGFWLVSLEFLLRYLEGEKRIAWLYYAAAGSGLAVAANLTLLFPCAAVGLVFLVLLERQPQPEPSAKKRRGRSDPPQGSPAVRALLHFALPAALLAWLIIAQPVSNATRDNFYTGAGSLIGMAASLAPAVPWAALLFPAIFGAAIWFSRDLLALAAPVLLGLLILAHYAAGLTYPEGRTGLYWIPLTALALSRLAVRWKALAAIHVLLVMLFAAGFSLGPYRAWAYDGGTRRFVDAIAAQTRSGPVRIGATWQLEPALNFYRIARRYDWMEPVTRQSPDGPCDYYVLWQPDLGLVERLHLQVLQRDEKAGTLLARRMP